MEGDEPREKIMTKISENERALMKSVENSIRKEINMQENLNIFLNSETNRNILKQNYELTKEKF